MFRLFENSVNAYPQASPRTPPKRFFGFIWAATDGIRPLLLGLTLLTAVIGAFEALLFAMLGRIVDWLSKSTPSELFTDQRSALILLLVILFLSPIAVFFQNLIKHQALAGNFPMRMRWIFHRQMLQQSLSFYQDEFAGRVAAKVMQTALAVRDTWFILADIMVFITIYFFTMVAVVGSFDLWLLIPFLLWLGFYALMLWYFVPRLGKVAEAQADARSLMTGRVTDAYTNITTVKLFSHAQREASYVKHSMLEFIQTVYKQWRLITGFEVLNQILSMFLIAGTGGLALWLWTRNEVGIGAVAAATAMALRLNGISHWVMWEMASLFENVGTVRDGMNTLTREHTILDVPNAPAIQVRAGELRFENVSFSYGNDAGHEVISKLNMTIKPGEKIGLVGRSGAGKSTLVNLLLRFYDVSSGKILIDGQDIALVQQDSLRASIGMVTQDTSLLHRSVRENIVYGRPEAGESDVIAATESAEASGFITQLEDAKGRKGLDAHVGERGVKLSGGQRQRIAIARVMLKDAPILLLDEATSALDSEVEAAIQASLDKLMQGKTVVAIAHRLSTIAAMDRLIVLDQGRIVEEGDHHALLARQGIYAKLWQHQSGGFLADDVIA